MPLVLAVFWGAIVSLMKFLLKKMLWANARFYLFFGLWVSIYLVVLSQTSKWLQELLRDQSVFSNQWWLMGISLLPSNAAFCLATVGMAYSIFWIAVFKRTMTEKYKASVESK